MISVSVLVALGSNNLIRRRPVADIMRDLRRFKALVLGIARGTSQGTPTLRCAPQRTKYKGNDHEPRVDLSGEFVELTRRIVDFNNESATNNNPNLLFAPQFGCHVRKYDDRNPRNLRYVPVDHRYEEWREKKKSDMLQLNERRSIHYFF